MRPPATPWRDKLRATTPVFFNSRAPSRYRGLGRSWGDAASKGVRLPSATAVIPAINEAASLGSVLDAVPRDLIQEIIVVDGGSRDSTVMIAAAHGATILHELRRGYGRACAAGAEQARGDIIVFLDADGAADPREIARLLAPIADGAADLVLGSRLAGSIAPGAMPWHQRIGNQLCARLIRLIYGLPITDLGPFRAVRRAMLQAMPLENLNYGWPTEMIVKAARAGWRIAEVPVTCHRRTGGHSKISGTARGTALATWHILGTIVGRAAR
jgi:cellulose synthase/poly-beta-1,6-N-acetylglucosamine synthase-like glycosyltransferase